MSNQRNASFVWGDCTSPCFRPEFSTFTPEGAATMHAAWTSALLPTCKRAATTLCSTTPTLENSKKWHCFPSILNAYISAAGVLLIILSRMLMI